jgi:hypothetical protein
LWYFVFSLVSAIWYLHSVCVQFLQKKIWSDILSFASIKSGILTFLYFLQFDISVLSLQLFWYFIFSSVSAIWYLHSVFAKKKFGVIFCLPLLQNLVFRLFFSFCHGIYYQRDYLVMMVTCWYESFLFSSYSYVLWQPEFYSDCSQLSFSSERSTLRSIVILLVHHLKHDTITLPFVPSSLQISLPRCISSLVFVF